MLPRPGSGGDHPPLHPNFDATSTIRLPGVKSAQGGPRILGKDSGQPENMHEEDPNPFILPHEDVFLMREREKQVKLAEKARQATLKVWEKNGDHGHRISKRDHIPRPRKGASALKQDRQIFQGHRREKENMTEFISKKRDMFLTQMSLDTKREEIQKLEEKAAMKEDALKKAEMLLEEDANRFGEFLKENDQNAHDALKKADIETKEKQEKVAYLKKLTQDENKYINEISKKKDTLRRCKEYRAFLDNLSPNDFKQEQKRKREAKIKAKQEARVAQGLPRDDPDESSSEEEMYFKYPEELLAKFAQLEKRCLDLLEQKQVNEEALEGRFTTKHPFALSQTSSRIN
jgi:hypothetical protein